MFFLKDILEMYDDTKPTKTTIATLLTRLLDKKIISYKSIGNIREYYPLVKRQDFYATMFNELVAAHFNGSKVKFISFLMDVLELKNPELKDIGKLAKQALKNKKKD